MNGNEAQTHRTLIDPLLGAAGWYVHVESLPRTATGKIAKLELKKAMI